MTILQQKKHTTHNKILLYYLNYTVVGIEYSASQRTVRTVNKEKLRCCGSNVDIMFDV